MTVHHEIFRLNTKAEPAFYDVTDEVLQIVSRSGIRDGVVVVYSQHTTCSIMIQEESHDTTYDETKYLLRDLLDVFESIVPRYRREGQYLHPGPAHIDYVMESLGEPAAWSLNTDAHLRSSLMGRSESIPVVDGEVQLGEFGQIYFVDFDGVRERERIVQVQAMGERGFEA
jgi:thiamine phosphate synthase YjbQ (UPF0047 family)